MSGPAIETALWQFDVACAALEAARAMLRKSRVRFTDDETDKLSARIADVLESLDRATKAAQSRFP